MKPKNLHFRSPYPFSFRYGFIAIITVIILSLSIGAAAQDTTNLAGQLCPQWVHDSYTVVGPDGNVYPTWHPPVDPTYGCWFDHEHGSDPHKFVGFASFGMPPFGYTSAQAGKSEPHEGFKVYVTNDDLNGRAWMIVLHQGTRGPARAFTQFHSLDWYISTKSGQKLVQIRTMADFGYASPNCVAPGDPTPGQFIVIPNSGSGYPFSGYQPQRRFVPTVGCAATTPYETWNSIVNIANVFKAGPGFDIDNASTVINPDNPTEIRYMCEFLSPNEDCASFYNTRWSGNKRGVRGPQQTVNNPGPQEFYTDPYGHLVTVNTPGSIKQFVTNQGWSTKACFCATDVFRLDKGSGGLYISPDPGAGQDLFIFGPEAAGVPPPPPATATPPPPPTPVPTGPTVIVSVNPATAKVGDPVEVDVNVANLTGLYGLQTQCVVDPNVLMGTSHSDGTIFTSGNSFFVDSGFKAGNWTVAASLLKPNQPFSGAGIAYKLNYTVQNAGSSPVTCTALAVKKNGHELPTMVINGSFNGAPVVEPPVVQPTVEPPTPVPPPVETPPVSQLSTIAGVMSYENHPDNSGITVQLVTPDSILMTATTGADGHYSFTDVPVGSYGVTAIAPQTLRIGKTVDVTADGQVIDLGNLVLPAGDTDDNGTIDIADASLIGANFDGTVPPSPDNADLNLDSKVDVSDLVLVGGNFGLTGPVIK